MLRYSFWKIARAFLSASLITISSAQAQPLFVTTQDTGAPVLIGAVQTSNPDFERALAASASSLVVNRGKLSHPERFGLLGRLVGHQFYHGTQNGTTVLKVYAYDSNTIEIATEGQHQFYRSRNGGFIHAYNDDSIGGDHYSSDAAEPTTLAPDSFELYKIPHYLDAGGNLVRSYNGVYKTFYWAAINNQSKSALTAQSVMRVQSLRQSIALMDKDIAEKCPSGAVNFDCAVKFKVRNETYGELGESGPDQSGEDFFRTRDAQIASQNTAMIGQAAGIVASGFAARVAPGSTSYGQSAHPSYRANLPSHVASSSSLPTAYPAAPPRNAS